MSLEFHDVADIFPMMDDRDFEALKENIETHGLKDPVILHQGKIVDGRNRYRACTELGIPVETRKWNGVGSLVEFVFAVNFHRRHLSSSQKAAVATEIEERLAKEAKEKQRAAGGNHGNQYTKDRATSSPRNSGANGSTSAAPSGVAVRERIPEAPAPRPRDKAAKMTGTNSRYVQDAKTIKSKSPELHKKILDGKITVPRAKRALDRAEKRATLEAKREAAPKSALWSVVNADCISHLESMPDRSVRLIFADPPYNQGMDYGSGRKADLMPKADYIAWVEQWMRQGARLLTDDGSMWVMISDEYAAHFRLILEEKLGLHPRNWIKWYETFGNNCETKFNRCSRHIFYMVKNPKRYVFNPDAVNRTSGRQELGDKRANPDGKNWDDVWCIPRLVENAKERLPDFPTQLPLALLNPIVGCASDPGDLVVDPFCGSGTTGEAALRLGRRFLGIEKDARYAELSRTRLAAVKGECP